jgi:uridine kinase
MEDILVIGIAGGSGSGKTTLVRNLTEKFAGQITVISHDNYYKRHDEMTYEERCQLNYDEPAAFETDLMVRQLQQLRQGQAIDCPVYDFTVHNRSNDVTRIVPSRVILVEGILIFADPDLRQLMDIRIFVDTDADIRICRRMKRDVNKRGRSLESVIWQYQQTVKPMHEKNVEPSKKYAHIVVLEGGKNMVALDMIEGCISRHLEAEGSL